MSAPLQNRVTPFGDIVAISQRGLFTGNRGIIHDPASKTLLNKRWSSKAWLVCTCEYEGRRRDVMANRSWTELFFWMKRWRWPPDTVPVSSAGATPPRHFAPHGPVRKGRLNPPPPPWMLSSTVNAWSADANGYIRFRGHSPSWRTVRLSRRQVLPIRSPAAALFVGPSTAMSRRRSSLTPKAC